MATIAHPLKVTKSGQMRRPQFVACYTDSMISLCVCVLITFIVALAMNSSSSSSIANTPATKKVVGYQYEAHIYTVSGALRFYEHQPSFWADVLRRDLVEITEEAHGFVLCETSFTDIEQFRVVDAAHTTPLTRTGNTLTWTLYDDDTVEYTSQKHDAVIAKLAAFKEKADADKLDEVLGAKRRRSLVYYC